MFERITTLIISDLMIKPKLIALDGSGFTNDYADKYYAIIRRKERKSYVKNHISIDVEIRLILHFAAQRGPRFDTRFAIAAIRNIKKYKPKYILADKAYDTEPIRRCINKEAKAQDQIPLKTRAKKGHYRLKSKNKFKKEIYSKRNNEESIFSIIKRKFSGINKSKTTRLINKTQNTSLQYLQINHNFKMRISTNPLNKGCGTSGRDLNSGCAWVARK